MSGRAVETMFVFDRHAATDLSVAYGILVPERATRPIPATVAGQEGWLAGDQQEDPGKQHDFCEQRPDRPRTAARDGQLEFDLQLGYQPGADRGDLRAGVLGTAEEGRDDRLPDRGAARARGRRRVECA